MAPSGTAYHVDWIFSNNSNVHVANHRNWFTNFTDFKTHTGSAVFGSGGQMEVLGVGDVELDLDTVGSGTGPGKIVLKDVLYAPSAICNILGRPVVFDYGVTSDFGNRRTEIRDKQTGSLIGIMDHNRLLRLRLAGHSATETSLDPNTAYMIHATWDEDERARWAAFTPHKAQALPGLTPEERSWLKKNYGNEWKFLRAYGLKMSRDEERAEGRAILKAMMIKGA